MDRYVEWLNEQIKIASQLVQKYERKDFDLEDEWYIRQRTLEDARDAYIVIQTPDANEQPATDEQRAAWVKQIGRKME